MSERLEQRSQGLAHRDSLSAGLTGCPLVISGGALCQFWGTIEHISHIHTWTNLPKFSTSSTLTMSSHSPSALPVVLLPAPPALLPWGWWATRKTWLLRFMIVPISYLQCESHMARTTTVLTCRMSRLAQSALNPALLVPIQWLPSQGEQEGVGTYPRAMSPPRMRTLTCRDAQAENPSRTGSTQHVVMRAQYVYCATRHVPSRPDKRGRVMRLALAGTLL